MLTVSGPKNPFGPPFAGGLILPGPLGHSNWPLANYLLPLTGKAVQYRQGLYTIELTKYSSDLRSPETTCPEASFLKSWPFILTTKNSPEAVKPRDQQPMLVFF